MKRYLLLLSYTLLLVNLPVLAADSDSKPAKTGSSKKLTIPPPPKETTPGNTRVQVIQPTQSTGTAVSAAPQADKNITVIGHGGPYVAKDNKVQRFADYLNINAGAENGPLSMTLTNDGFKWFRLLISNQVVATEKSLGGKESGKIDLSGIVGPGNNQVAIEAGGVPGSRIEWKVTTATAAKLSKADPGEGLVGDDIKITGKNLSTHPNEDKVSFNGHPALVTSATDSELHVRIPSNAEPGENKVYATIRGVKTNSIKVKVVVTPEVTGTNLGQAPPGFDLTIYGRHFAKSAGENKVYIGNYSAQVLSGDENHLNVKVPNIGDPNQPVLGGLDWRQSTPGNYDPSMGSLPVKVQVGKLVSKENISFIIGRKIYPGMTGNQFNVGPGTENPYNPPGGGPTYGAPQANTPREMGDNQ